MCLKKKKVLTQNCFMIYGKPTLFNHAIFMFNSVLDFFKANFILASILIGEERGEV